MTPDEEKLRVVTALLGGDWKPKVGDRVRVDTYVYPGLANQVGMVMDVPADSPCLLLVTVGSRSFTYFPSELTYLGPKD